MIQGQGMKQSMISQQCICATMKSIFLSHMPMHRVILCVISCKGSTLEFTALSYPHSLDFWSSSLFAYSKEMKLCMTLVYTMILVSFPFI